MSLIQEVHQIIKKNPVLLVHKRKLLGCCRHRASDMVMKKRIEDFLENHPEFCSLLEPILEA